MTLHTFILKRVGMLFFATYFALIASGGAEAAVDEHGCSYQDGQPYLSYCADEGKWYVRPSNLDSASPDYGLVDADRLQEGIDAAGEGETLVVMAGTWIFDALYNTDFDVHTAAETFKHYEDWLLPQWDYIFATSDHHQDIDIDKAGLTVTGEITTGPFGERIPLTIITTSLEIDDHGYDWWDGYNGSFLINAPNVTLMNLRVEKFVHPVWAYSPGFDIKHNEFFDCGFGHYLTPNVELTYPNWPDTGVSIPSYYRHNTLINNGQPPHLVGSEVLVTNNHFDYRNLGFVIFPWGDINDPNNIIRPEPYPINWDLGQNNVVKDNYFNCNGHTMGIGVWNLMSDLRDNQIVGNTFEDCRVGIWVVDSEPSSEWNNTGTVVTGNTFRDILSFAINPYSYADPDGVVNCDVSGNVFENVGYNPAPWALPVAIWAETGVVGCQFRNNDFTNSGSVLDILFDGRFSEGIYYGPKQSLVNERYFADGTTLCDRFYDASITDENPYGENRVVGWNRLCAD